MTVIGFRNPPEQVAGIKRNQWPEWAGICRYYDSYCIVKCGGKIIVDYTDLISSKQVGSTALGKCGFSLNASYSI